MADQFMICVDCATVLKSIEEAQEHADLTSHSNFSESPDALLNRICCTTCRKPCQSQSERDLHTKRTGHADFNRLTSETAVDVQKEEEMVVPLVDAELVKELEAKGFTTARATRALHYSGNTSMESAINWSMEHEHDMDIDEMPLVPASPSSLGVKSPKPLVKAQLPKSEKERSRIAKEIVRQKLEEDKAERRRKFGAEAPIVSEPVAKVDPAEAKRIHEENQRKKMLQQFQKEKEERERAKEIVRRKLEEDKAQRRRRFGLPDDAPIVSIPIAKEEPERPVERKKTLSPSEIAAKAEQMRNCLRSLKLNHKDDEAKVKTAFQTLLTYLGNVAKNPSEEKFRKIRLSNPSFHERVGSLEEGIQFLELCGFEKIEDGEFLYLARDKVDKAVLNSAGSELNSATVSFHWSSLSK